MLVLGLLRRDVMLLKRVFESLYYTLGVCAGTGMDMNMDMADVFADEDEDDGRPGTRRRSSRGGVTFCLVS